MPYEKHSKNVIDRLDFLEAIVGSTDAIVVATDAEGKLIWVNEAFVRTTGFGAQEVRGKPIWSFRVPEEIEPGRQAFQASTGQQEGRRFESRWLTRDGRTIFLSWSTRTVSDEDGNVRFRVGTAIDVTGERQSEERALDLRYMLEQVGEAVILVDRDSVIRYANREAEELYRTPLNRLIGMPNRAFVPEHQTEAYEQFSRQLHETMEPAAIETWRICGDGAEIPVHLRVSPLRARDGQLTGFVSVSYDISKELALEKKARAVAEHNALLAVLLNNLPDPVFHMKPDGTLGYVNAAVRDVYGYRPEELIGGPMSRVRPIDKTDHMDEFIRRAIETGETGITETQALRKDGRRIDVELRAVRLDDEEGNYAGIAGFARDIGARKRMELELQKFANTDDLTGLANRRHFEAVAAAEVKRSKRYGNPLSLITCDLDHFKSINDNHGHDAGDLVLQRFAQVARESLRLPTDVAARLGGEEFAILLPETGAAGAKTVAERIRRQTQQMSVEKDGQTLQVTVSIGLSEVRSGEEDIAPALKRADMALYEAKGGGRNRIELFEGF